MKHHLVPKVKGTWLCVENLHDKFDAIYDVSVFYEGSVDKGGIRKNAPQLIGNYSIIKYYLKITLSFIFIDYNLLMSH